MAELVLPDEFQDGSSPGSLVQARRCWLDLLAAPALHPQRLAFDFHCPTERMAAGLMQYLRHADPGGHVRTHARAVATDGAAWRIVGTTNAPVWSLGALEHLFMRLCLAGRRYESTLDQLSLLSREPVG